MQAEGNAGKKSIIVDFKSEEGRKVAVDLIRQGCQMAKFDPFLSLDCLGLEGTQSKERKGSNFAA